MTSRLKSDHADSVAPPSYMGEVSRETGSTKFPDQGSERRGAIPPKTSPTFFKRVQNVIVGFWNGPDERVVGGSRKKDLDNNFIGKILEVSICFYFRFLLDYSRQSKI
jgi:hypothetical protein